MEMRLKYFSLWSLSKIRAEYVHLDEKISDKTELNYLIPVFNK